jgi:Fur family transcriptional regulator, iron response regulator
MKKDAVTVLRDHGIQPSAQRVAVANYVLNTCDHPSAEKVAAEVRKSFPMISRATVYNTLNLMVEKGLLREFVLDDGKTVFDANVSSHHHFVDERSGRIYDIPWESLMVSRLESLKGFEVKEYQVVVRGRVKGASRKRA